MLDLPGGGRSLPEARAVLLASHGFVTLALNYLNPRRTAGGEYHVGNDYFQVTLVLKITNFSLRDN